jgi:hypothetical protein
MKATFVADAFDSGRSPQELQGSFERSFAKVID